jgi:hypothetical protein
VLGLLMMPSIANANAKPYSGLRSYTFPRPLSWDANGCSGPSSAADSTQKIKVNACEILVFRHTKTHHSHPTRAIISLTFL